MATINKAWVDASLDQADNERSKISERGGEEASYMTRIYKSHVYASDSATGLSTAKMATDK